MSKQPEKTSSSGGKSPEVYLNTLLSRGVWTKTVAIRKLIDRDVPEAEAESLVEKYEELGYFDDGAYAFLFVESHPEWGMYRLRDELRRRGVAQKHILHALDEVDEDERALLLAADWISGGMERRRVEERLLRRGFSHQACRNALERACEGER